ncbi:morphogenic membrane protein MmpA [Streptomyces incanus]|uniref:Morphogenic membrane protein MmpA n=1 Tax=Streptomyces incanus TaxID=887453 RepID=A0ABW0XTD5_9ACTN
MTTHRASRSVAAMVRPSERAVALGPAPAVLAGGGWIAGTVRTVPERPFRERPCAPGRQSRSAPSLLTSCEPAPRRPFRRRPLPPRWSRRVCLPPGCSATGWRRAAAPSRRNGRWRDRTASAPGGSTGRAVQWRTVAKRLLARSCAEWKVFLASSV